MLCTGNICRSPVAEALLAHRTAALGVGARVHSAGLLRAGQPASASSVDLLAARGIDASGHLSTTMSRELLIGADLVLGMAREHVREAVVLALEAWPRTFTLKELVRRGGVLGPRSPGEDIVQWLAAAHGGRTTSELMGSSDADDVADPIGQGHGAYERMVLELEGLVDQLVGLLWAAERERARA